jgi:undecaprenyl phosphate-alpha-L-ara4N flippase subunit ArnE
MPLWVHGLLLISSLAAAGGQVLLSKGAAGRASLLEFINVWVVAGFGLYFIGSAIWVYGLSRGPLTTVYPYTALTFVLVCLSGAVFYGETVSPRALAGIACVLLGLLLINLR